MEIVNEIRYRKIEQIGVGQGMNSEVWLAFDPQVNGEVAVKEIQKSNLGNTLALYFDEASAMFASAHPNVVPVHYACQNATQVCVAMPYYPAGSLHSRIRTNPLPPKECLRIAHGLLHGLTRIHLKRFLHLDLKPSNVLFDDTDRPLVADFGQSRSLSSEGLVVAPRMYKFAFPPETLLTSVATVQSDVYQVGLLLYRAINGDPVYEQQVQPWQTLREKILRGKFPDRNLFMPHVPKHLRTVIRKALQVDPVDRYHSASEMSDALARVKVGLDWTVHLASCGKATWRASREGCPDVVVQRSSGGYGNFSVCVYTARGTELRAKCRHDFWREGLSPKEADDHLKKVFVELAG